MSRSIVYHEINSALVREKEWVIKKLFFCLTILAPFAFGQSDVTQGLLECSAIEGDEARLVCYDKLVDTASPPEVSSSDNWYVSVDTNPVDDSTTIFYATESIEGSTTSTYGDPFYLKLRCKSGELAAWISWNEYLGLDKTNVTYRIGTDQAVTDQWYISTDNKSSFFSVNQDPTKRFIDKLSEADNGRLIAQVTPYSESTDTAIFNISGLKTMLPDLYERCQ